MEKGNKLVTAKSRVQELAPGTKVVGYVEVLGINDKAPSKVWKRKSTAKKKDAIREHNRLMNLQNKFNGKV